jgi:hypothetical protein
MMGPAMTRRFGRGKDALFRFTPAAMRDISRKNASKRITPVDNAMTPA